MYKQTHTVGKKKERKKDKGGDGERSKETKTGEKESRKKEIY